MSAGLFGLLDDVATIAKMAAASMDDVSAAAGKATAKAAGVVVDDTAVTPQYVQGLAAERELPIVKRIAWGSIRNKLLIILPAALLLSHFLPDALPILLMLGGSYLAFEGAEKVWTKLAGHHAEARPAAAIGPEAEDAMIAGAVRTDLILSAEIMVIALATVAHEGFWLQLATLVVVAFVITIGVYGVVALIVKMDDIGLALAAEHTGLRERLGRGLVAAMPKVLAAITLVGTVAMLWVGGHLLLLNLHDLGWWTAPYDAVHHLEHAIHEGVGGTAGSVLGWCWNTFASFVAGLLVGAVLVLVMHLLPLSRSDRAEEQTGTP